ncbi:MAG: hypothetical protein DRQ13_07125 [Ignavibacteriae bacterium]|nr:MAG: hypothetical protein DRQ13_07125 [Ignavibacteriota bacterium]
MKKKVVLSGGLKEMVTYCTAIYEVNKDVDTEYLTNIVSKSPIFENKSFYTNVLGTVQRTTVTRKTNLFVKDNTFTLQIRYDILNVVDIELTEKDEDWIKNDVESLLKHFELLVTPFDEGNDE